MANLNWYMAKHNVTRNDFKIAILKKGIGIKNEKTLQTSEGSNSKERG